MILEAPKPKRWVFPCLQFEASGVLLTIRRGYDPNHTQDSAEFCDLSDLMVHVIDLPRVLGMKLYTRYAASGVLDLCLRTDTLDGPIESVLGLYKPEMATPFCSIETRPALRAAVDQALEIVAYYGAIKNRWGLRYRSRCTEHSEMECAHVPRRTRP